MWGRVLHKNYDVRSGEFHCLSYALGYNTPYTVARCQLIYTTFLTLPVHAPSFSFLLLPLTLSGIIFYTHLPLSSPHRLLSVPHSGRGGMRGGAKVVVEPHRFEGVFVARGKDDALLTKNSVTGESVYGEKRIAVEVCGWEWGL